MENLSIRFWAEDDRPREKMLHKGRGVLSNSELLAILIGSGTRKKSAVELAQEILNSCDNNLRKLSKITIPDLCKFDGIGEAKAVSIMAAMELARRRDAEQPEIKNRITSSKEAYGVFKSVLTDLYHEEFHILILTQSNVPIKTELISKGGMKSTIVDSRVLFQKVLEAKGSSIILAHNHPSGSLEPSTADKKLTQKLKEIGTFLEIPILDHLIITDSDYFSFADEGIM